jgi:hypothetical protein
MTVSKTAPQNSGDDRSVKDAVDDSEGLYRWRSIGVNLMHQRHVGQAVSLLFCYRNSCVYYYSDLRGSLGLSSRRGLGIYPSPIGQAAACSTGKRLLCTCPERPDLLQSWNRPVSRFTTRNRNRLIECFAFL